VQQRQADSKMQAKAGRTGGQGKVTCDAEREKQPSVAGTGGRGDKEDRAGNAAKAGPDGDPAVSPEGGGAKTHATKRTQGRGQGSFPARRRGKRRKGRASGAAKRPVGYE